MSGKEGREPVVGWRDFRLPRSSPAFLSGRGHQPESLSFQCLLDIVKLINICVKLMGTLKEYYVVRILGIIAVWGKLRKMGRLYRCSIETIWEHWRKYIGRTFERIVGQSECWWRGEKKKIGRMWKRREGR